ncbi:hypothetical protein F511_34846 [Dorcoceras hygrometricum]|uniref:Acyl-CoA dehydrogenase-related protein n=1 Tax=Dorcoceras hygrometricum TaxID=472368 RepID=A0A2Z7BBQ0_9LAMI|nr:hypothetical protein F511_34846 [Dorcoceras hygrometricum]
MSLFDLQDVCIAIGSIATLDLPMVVDLIGIYGLKGPYCTLTTTNWFLKALSVIPRGSWGDPPPPPCAAAASSEIFSGQFDEENPSAQISSCLLVQGDEGVSYPVVDRIGDIYRNLPRRADVIVTTIGARHKCQQVDWAVKMRIRPPEIETSVCDVKYHVSLSTGCVLGKWVCLVTLAMSLFDLQDVCIVIGSLANLDLPMVVDLIEIYVLKGPYCTLTTINWFLQALSVIPRGSWGDVARCFTMIRWASPKL